jgi:hypothetical protein
VWLVSLLFRERRAASFSLPARGVATGPITTPTQDQALRHSAVWACVNLIADMISPLPIDRYQRVDGVAVAKTDTTIVEDPGVGIDRISWIRQVLVSWLSSGNVFHPAHRVHGLHVPAPCGRRGSDARAMQVAAARHRHSRLVR